MTGLMNSIHPHTMSQVTANGKTIETDKVPCSIEAFLIDQELPPRSVVVELNGNAIAPSDFTNHQVQPGDSLEIVKIVAGG